jgi:hypothetical protein
LGVDYPGARSSIPTQAGSQPLPKRRVKLLPGSVDSPPPEVVVDGLPRWELIRQKSPSAAALEDVVDSVEDLAGGVDPGSSSLVGRREVGL